jgi:tetratricopeptide (TPR) repeat protein
MRLTPRHPRTRDTPAARAEARELRKRAFAAAESGMPARAMADADAVMAAHADAGPAGEPYLSARLWRAVALGRLGQHAAAAGELARLIEDAVPLLGDKHVTVLGSRINRAGQLSCLARYDEAEAECRAAIRHAGKKRIWPDIARERIRLSAIAELVVALNGRGLHAQGESAARSAIRETRGSGGVHAHSLVSLRVVLASSLTGQHRYEEARRILQGIRPGHWHPAWTVGIQTQLAAAELGLGMPGEAEARAREAVTEAERISGPAHYTTLRAGTLLGSAIARQGRPDEARHQLQANAEAWLEHFGEDHPRTVAAYQELLRVGHDET